MLLGYCIRPPYWKVLLRFCSHALAIPGSKKGNRLMDNQGYTFRTVVMDLWFVWCISGLSTLILHPWTLTGVLKELQHKGLHDVRAAIESCQDVQQPPSSLTTVPAQHTHTTTNWSTTVIKPSGRTWCKMKKKSYGLELVLAVTCFITWQ